MHYQGIKYSHHISAAVAENSEIFSESHPKMTDGILMLSEKVDSIKKAPTSHGN